MTPDQLAQARILLVDDDHAILKLMRRVLEQQGLTSITPCDCVREAPRVFAELGPDLVLLDLTMPGGGGLSLLTELVQCDPTVPVLVLTGYTDPETRRQCLAAGAREVLTKPLLPDAMDIVFQQLARRLGV